MKSLLNKESKIMKELKKNYVIARRVYNSLYENVAEHFKIYLKSLSLDEKELEGIENAFRINANGRPE